jgi:hypothetical protein
MKVDWSPKQGSTIPVGEALTQRKMFRNFHNYTTQNPYRSTWPSSRQKSYQPSRLKVALVVHVQNQQSGLEVGLQNSSLID